MARTFLRSTQIRQSDSYSDVLDAGSELQSGSTSVESDLNALRSQMKRALGTANWYASPVSSIAGLRTALTDELASEANTRSTADGTLQTNINTAVANTATNLAAGLASALSDRQAAETVINSTASAIRSDLTELEDQKVLARVAVLVDVAVSGGANHVLLTAAQAPSINAAIAAGVDGAICSQSATSGGAFAEHELIEVAGANAIDPKNLVIIRDATTGAPITSSDRDVFGLIQVSSAQGDNAVFSNSSSKISFVRLNAALDDLEACPPGDIGGKTINYQYPRRLKLDNMPEEFWLSGHSFTDHTTQVDVTAQRAYTNQGTTPVEMATSAILDLSAAGSWSIRSNDETQRFSVNANGVAVSGQFEVATTLQVSQGSNQVYVGGALEVVGASTIAALTASGAAILQSTLDVTGVAILQSTLGVTGATSLTSLTASGNATVGGTLGVTGTTSLTSLTASGNATVGGTFGVTGATSLTSLTASGNATVGGTLGVTGTSTIAALTASGAASFGSTVGVTGVATLSSSLSVAGNSTLAAVAASGVATFGSTVGITGAATLSSSLVVSGASNVAAITASGVATLNSNLVVSGVSNIAAITASGAAILQSTLAVTGTSTIAALTASGAAALNSTLAVASTSSFGGDITIETNLAVGSGSIAQTGAMTLSASTDLTLGSYGDSIPLAVNAADWAAFDAEFPGATSILACLALAKNSSTASKTFAVVNGTVAAATDVGGVNGGANLDVQLPNMSGAASLYDVFVNGSMLRPGETNDYYPGTSAANGQIKFEFGLKLNDVICVVTRTAQ